MLHEESRKSGPAKGSARRGFGRLRRLPSKRWQVAYTGPDAQVHKAATTFEDEDAARGWLANERRLIELDTWTPPQDRVAVKKAVGQTLAEFATDWLEKRRTPKGELLKPRTRADYRRYLDRHIEPELGDVPIKSLTRTRVETWYEGLNAETPTQRAHAYQLLRAICTTAVARKLMATNPCRIPGAGKASRAKRIRPATIQELADIADHMPERLRLAVLLGAWCALRYGEIAELRRRDFDLKRETLTVSRGVTWPSVLDKDGTLVSAAVVTTPKSAAGSREVHIPPHLISDVRKHLKDHTGPGRDGLLFASSTGRHIHPRAFGWKFHQARTASGRPDLRFHDLRHTGAVLAAQTGATLAELMARLGHATPSAAMRYQHAAADRDRAIAAALSKMVTGSESPSVPGGGDSVKQPIQVGGLHTDHPPTAVGRQIADSDAPADGLRAQAEKLGGLGDAQ